jgi:hypothetical protein
MVEHPWSGSEVLDDVVAAARVDHEGVGTRSADQPIVAGTAVQVAMTGAFVQMVTTIPAQQAIRRLAAEQPVIPFAAGKMVGTQAASQEVVAIAALQVVVAFPSTQPVTTTQTEDQVHEGCACVSVSITCSDKEPIVAELVRHLLVSIG